MYTTSLNMNKQLLKIAFCLYIRYSTPAQGFELCANPTEPGVNGCNNIGWDELLLYPAIIYGIWVSYYVLIVGYYILMIMSSD